MLRRSFLLILIASFSANAQDRAAIRAKFLKIIERPRVPLNPELQPGRSSQGLIVTHFTFATEAQERVPGIIVKPENTTGRGPAIIALHGTGDSKEGMLDVLTALAARGFLAVAIDGRYHGDRKSVV